MLLRNHKTKEAIDVWKSLLAAYPDDEELCEDIIELHIEEGLSGKRRLCWNRSSRGRKTPTRP